MEWKKVKDKIVGLQGDFDQFKAEFFDREKFREFANALRSRVGEQTEICITGYFSEAIRKELERILQINRNVRLICPYFPISKSRDKKNLQALKKLKEAGAKIRVNDRLHARFLVSYISEFVNKDNPIWRGWLLIGSFDINTECIGTERYDAGIKTSHPDMIESAVKLFDEIWNESLPLLEKYGEEVRKLKL